MTQIRSAEHAIDIIEEEFRKMAERESVECVECGEIALHPNVKFCGPCANKFYGGDNG